MKKIISAALALTVAVSFVGCSAKQPADETPKSDDQEIATMHNPIHTCTAEQVAADTGFLLTAPEGAENVVFSSIEGTPMLAEMRFQLNGVDYSYRIIADVENKDISGMYYTWTSNDTAELAGRSAELNWIEGAQGHISWIDMVPGVHYDLAMESGASKEALTAMAKQLFHELQGTANGEDAGSFAMDFSALLSEFSENYQPGTSGISLRYAAFASKLADLFTECAPTEDAVTNCVEGFTETLDAASMGQFPEMMNSTLTVFRELASEHGGDLQSACGYTPANEWDAEALEPLFRAMCMAVPGDMVYAGIVEKYVSAIQAGNDRQTMRDNDLNDLAADVGDTPLETIGYAIDDLDGDGVRELIIGTISEDDFLGKLILDLYTLDETGAPKLLFRSGERDRLYSVGDRIFANVGSSGANDSVNKAFILEEGSLNPAEGSIDPKEYAQLDLTPLSQW